jgi:septum formation topological specificity factor MinE
MKLILLSLFAFMVILSATNMIFSQSLPDNVDKNYYQHGENVEVIGKKDMLFSVTTVRTVYVPCEPIEIKINLENKANTRKFFWNDFRFIKVINSNLPHQVLKPLRKNKSIYNFHKTGRWSPSPFEPEFIIQANEKVLIDTVDVNHLYDMTLSGKYYIYHSTYLQSVVNNDTKYIDAPSQKITIIINENTTNTSEVIPSEVSSTYSKPSHGISLSIVSDKSWYDNYGPVYLRVGTKNISDKSISMVVDAKNVFDVYELTLLTPGGNLDFRKPAAKNKTDVEKVDYTLYGQKLLAEKSKTQKPTTTVNPNEETAESIIVLNRIFDMSTDGIYGLIVTRKIIDAAGKEQIISSEPYPIRIGKSSTQDEIDESVKQRILDGNDPDYPTWQSRDGLFKVIAKFISVDKDIVTLEKPDGKKITFNISDLTTENQNYIKEQTQKNINTNQNLEKL